VPETDPTILQALRRLQLIDDQSIPVMIPLSGGVSSDIWRVELGQQIVCVKRALPQLKVSALWEAPIERNQYEWEWLQIAGAIEPTAAPALIARDLETGCFVMEYLDTQNYPVWKNQLRDGITDPNTAKAVGQRLASIHAATAGQDDIRNRFPTDHIFHAIRIEPYLLETARRHEDLATDIRQIVNSLSQTKQTLVHGDVSPKNILVGPSGPLFLDAECACYGDPVFDITFCLNHLMLKCIWTPHAIPGFLHAFDVLLDAYIDGVVWEDRATLEARAARTLPALFLARVDGKSPVDYITTENHRDLIRHVARELLLSPVETLRDVRTAWAEALERAS